jgi:hypothetical protein
VRNISAASLTALEQSAGLEPVIIVKIWWGGTTNISYADRRFESDGLVGKLLEISGIEDIIDINAAFSSVNLSVTLDDTDGEIKTIYDSKDIHKTYVQVLQWFRDIPLSDAFVIFEGEISSPISWTEGTRTLRFDIVTQLEDREIGFSVEEGQFQFAPASLVGQAWPVVFGTVAGLKIINLIEAPTAILASGFGIVDDEIWQAEIDDLDIAIQKAFDQAKEAHQLGNNNAVIAGAFKTFGPLPDDPGQAQQYDQAAQSFYSQAVDFSNEFEKLTAERATKINEWDLQKTLEFRVLPITKSNIPTGFPFTIEVGNYTASAVVIGDVVILTNLVEKVDVNEKTGTTAYQFATTDEYKKEFRGQKFVWIDGGTEIKIFNFPRYYIASINHVTVLNVWAQSKFGRSVVPRGWYTVDYVNYNGLLATRIIFPTPLTSYPGEWQDGDIEIDCVSDIGPNVVDIMEWAIDNFSSLTKDITSFNHVKALVNKYPANFALTDRKEIIQFLQEVAFQSRCAIWINDRKFFLRYLPEELEAVETIGDSDVEVNSIVVSSTETERLVTKFIATWREKLNQSEPNKIIYRYNVKKYGLHEETYDFYIYNHYSLVAKSAEFWMIRKANTWKRISCKVMLHKLRIETFDPVEFDFNEDLICTGPVTGIIEKATFNPDDDSISIEAWLPIRLGEMEKHKFAHPMTVQSVFPARDDTNVITGNPYADATGEIVPPFLFPPYQQTASVNVPAGTNTIIADSADMTPGNIITALDPAEINNTRPVGINNFNNEKKYKVKDITPFTFKTVTPTSMFGKVISKNETGTYRCNVYVNGIDGSPETLDVKIGFIPDSETLNENYPLTINRTVYTVNNGLFDEIRFEYWAQPPIWVDDEDNPTA